MTEQHKLEEIISLITFLQVYIQNNVNQSFANLTFSLETFVKDYLNVFEKNDEYYENANSIKRNYPAIDLINIKKGTALQVTTNADLRKVKKTLKVYEDNNLNFKNLIVIGFVSATRNTLPNVIVYGVEYLIELAKFGTSQQKEAAYDIIKRQIPLNVLHPLSDKQCFNIVFDVINRSAIRDYTIREGNFDKMIEGLFEIKEIITNGTIKGKSIRAKSFVEYTSPIKNKLAGIEILVSSIIQICNENKNRSQDDFLCLNQQEKDLIDDLKEQIMNETNDLAHTMGLGRKIPNSRR